MPYFDRIRASLACEFAEAMTLTKCTQSGKPELLTLLPHGRRLIEHLYGWRRDDGSRLIRRVYFSFARKNAKTQYAAVIALLELFMGEEMSPEVYMAAKDRDQASICYQAAADMVRACPELDDASVVTASRKTIYNPANNGFIKALSSEGKSKHGLNPSALILDELHSWDAAEQELYDALTTGSAARRNPLTVIITTAGTNQESICYREYEYAKRVLGGMVKDETYLPIIYEVDRDADWTDESLWPLANPALGAIIDIQQLREARDKALALPSEQNKFRRLHLNQWTSSETAWIPLKTWDACKGEIPDLSHVLCYCGLDLGATGDLTAFVQSWQVDGKVYVRPHFFLPGDGLSERSKRDNVRYDQWAADGLLNLTPGNVTDWRWVTQYVMRISSECNIAALAFDRYGARDVAGELKDGGLNVIDFGQGYISMSPPAKRLETLVLGGDLVHDGHPILRWNMDCCGVASDPAGNIKPIHPPRHRNSKRIDGVSALVMGLGVMLAAEGDEPAPVILGAF